MSERELFLAAIDLEDPRARASYLDRACEGDAALRAKVEALLSSHEEADGFLEEPAAFGEGATSAQTMPGGPKAGNSYSLKITQADVEVTQAHTPPPVADTILPTGDGALDSGRTTEGVGRASDGLIGAVMRYFGDYAIQEELGRGGMGVVYKALQVTLNRPVALKMIKAGVLADDAELRRFQNEAEAVALLDHPGIVPIYEVGEHDGQRYFSMKLVAGGNLADRLASFEDDPRAAATLVAEAAEAVQHAHLRGILHRDLKPANILVDAKGHPHITDFGLAKRIEGDAELTQSGAIMGTPAYMSPEQATGRRGAITTATDVYGLGAILYALLTGKAPFGKESVVETLDAVRTRPPESPRTFNAKVPLDLETIALKCLQKEPHRRYASARELAEDLNRHLAGEPILARPVGRLERLAKWARRRPAIAGLSAAVLTIGVVGLSGILWQWRAAVTARTVARKETEFARRRLYDVRMNQIQRFWEDWNPLAFHETLEEQRPENQLGVDRRGWEWYYWRRRMSTGPILRLEHTSTVSEVTFSPDGRRLITADSGGKYHQLITDDLGKSVEVSVIPSGRAIDFVGEEARARVWDADTGRETFAFTWHSREGVSVTYGPDGRGLASAGSGGTVKVWDANTGRETLTVELHTEREQLLSAAFSPDGRRLAGACRDGAVKVWDADTGRVALTIAGHSGPALCVTYGPDGRRIATAGLDGTVKMWDADTGRESPALEAQTPVELNTGGGIRLVGRRLAFSPDGRRLAYGGDDGTVKVWDADTGRLALTFQGKNGPVRDIVYSTIGSRIATGGLKTARVWDAATGQEKFTFRLRGDALDSRLNPFLAYKSVAFSPDGTRLASVDGPTVNVWDLSRNQETLTFRGSEGRVLGVAFSADGRRVASSNHVGAVKAWETSTGRETTALNGDASPMTRPWQSPDGSLIAFPKAGETAPSSGKDVETLVVVDSVAVIDVATSTEVVTLQGHIGKIMGVAFSRDRSRLACAGEAGAAEVWDLAVETARAKLIRDHAGQYDDAGKWLPGVVTVPRPTTLKGHNGGVRHMAFSPDGSRIATAGDDHTVKVWDAATGQETLTLDEHTAAVNSVAFSPDGTLIASASDDGTVKIWDARPVETSPQTPSRP